MSLLTCNLIELCIFKKENDQPLYLLLHRTKDEKIYPNFWQFVTGSIEENEKAADAALRELSEETGLKPKSFWVVPCVLSFYNADWDSVNLCPFFAAEIQDGKRVKISDEHDDFGWFTYDEANRKLELPEWKKGLGIVNEYIASAKEDANMHRIF